MRVAIVGCCGRAGLGLREYARRFEAMEVQETFYRIVGESALRRWRGIVGEGFHFTMKAFQGVSHPRTSPTWRRAGRLPGGRPENYGLLRDTEEVEASWTATERMADALGAEYVVVQMPASFGPSDENLRRVAEFFGRRRGERPVGLEVRGEGWLGRGEELASAMREAGVTHVTDPLSWPPVHVEGPAYFRLHGRLPRYDYQYSTGEILRLAEIARRYREAYVFFNNMAMAEDAARLSEALAGRTPRLPGPEERAEMIARRARFPADAASVARRFGYLRVGVDGEPTVGELLRDAGNPRLESPEDLRRILARRSGGTCSGKS
ncbi:MAG: DUF72 domain-containing protein [Conexivisphaera sp.]